MTNGNMTNGKVCVLGSFMMDLVARVPRRPQRGETVVGSSFAVSLGGKGFNQAVAAARMGATTRMIGRLGRDDFGERFAAALDQDGIDHTHVSIDPHLGTGVGLPLVEQDGTNSIIIVPRANLTLTPDHVRAAADAIEDADVLLLQFELPIETALAAAEIAFAAGTRVIVNPAPAVPPPPSLLVLTDILVPNEVEAAALATAPVDTPYADLAARLRALWGSVAVVVTRGANGVHLLDETGGRSFPATGGPAVDTVGAGDAFCGTLAAELARGAELSAAVIVAETAAGIAVTRQGSASAIATRDEVSAALQKATAR